MTSNTEFGPQNNPPRNDTKFYQENKNPRGKSFGPRLPNVPFGQFRGRPNVQPQQVAYGYPQQQYAYGFYGGAQQPQQYYG